MEKSYFFNSRDGNRLYNADSFAEAYKPLFTNGAFNGELQVLADSGMNVKVMPGHAWINGRSYWNTDEKVLTLKVAIGQKKRIDSVVVRLDEIEGEITAIALKGEEDLDPEPPVLQREAGYYDLRIAEILVRSGVLEIGQADITDTRMDAEKCGWVAGAVEQITFEQVTAQFDSFLKLYKKAKEDEFLDWFGHTEAAREAANNAKDYYEKSKGIFEDFSSSGDVVSVNGKAGAVTITAKDVGALPNLTSGITVGSLGNGTGGFLSQSDYKGVYMSHAVSFSGGFLPTDDNLFTLGSSPRRWKEIYGVNSTISTSDRNEKYDISFIGEGSRFDTNTSDELLTKLIMGMKPVVFKRANGESGRPHHGMIAQDIEELLDSLGIDHAGFIKSPVAKQAEIYEVEGREVMRRNLEGDFGEEIPEEILKQYGEDVKKRIAEEIVEGEFKYGLRYEEFIGDLIRFGQLLKKENEELKKEIQAIKSDMQLLKTKDVDNI